MGHPLDSIKCTHPDHGKNFPDHGNNETCEDRAVGCNKYCICCLGPAAEVNYWRDRAEELEVKVQELTIERNQAESMVKSHAEIIAESDEQLEEQERAQLDITNRICQSCTLCGNIDKCRKTECHQHESWYAIEQIKCIKRLNEKIITHEEKEWLAGALAKAIKSYDDRIQRRELLLEMHEVGPQNSDAFKKDIGDFHRKKSLAESLLTRIKV